MIADILTEWNLLTVVLAVWLGSVALTVGVDAAVDVVPDYYRKTRARAQLTKTMAMLAEQKKRVITFNPDETMKLGVFTIKPTPQRRRHAA
ncbi:hypothetical protein SEA_SCAP1_46 [Streptomyces phage Scap1]|uniref:Uncharacterized protein n=1 Tax=Streptomyces phage Scap1 TaxID=2041354 RepID=A0A2D1GP03_9CAUD|nr:hypothetical protein FDI71_gp46 [Streptomyces phage Scap1]ATN93695.1 hypothetical protein SEA_SCAP1_46 [Streptomyces phage Scap1]